MSQVRFTFTIERSPSDCDTLEQIFISLRSLFGEKLFYEVYDSLVYGNMFVEHFKRTLNHEKKHKKGL